MSCIMYPTRKSFVIDQLSKSPFASSPSWFRNVSWSVVR